MKVFGLGFFFFFCVVAQRTRVGSTNGFLWGRGKVSSSTQLTPDRVTERISAGFTKVPAAIGTAPVQPMQFF